MRTRKRSVHFAALAVGLALVAAACGSEKKGAETTPTSATAPPTSAEATTTGAPTTTSGATTTGGATTTAGGTGKGMKLTIEVAKEAVWDDGTPINVKDFQCLYDAVINTPGSLTTVGYDQITSIEQGKDDHEVVVTFKTVYAPYKTLFTGPSLLEASKVTNCKDVSADFQDNIPFSSREWKIDSWSPDQVTLVKNDKYWGPHKPIASQVVMVPKTDSDTELASLKSGEVDFIFPQAFSGITDALNDPSIKYTPGYGTNYEMLHFSEKPGRPLADPDFRAAFSMSIDRDAILKGIYDPIFPGAPLLNCGPWVPTLGKWCDNTAFEKSYDPAAAEKLLTEKGWKKNGEGLWADKDGKVPEIKWMINAGNSRRESTQALLIPLLKAAGFNVVADNCDAACVFQQRVPAGDFDLGMFISTASPDPTPTANYSCQQVPSEANQNKGANGDFWCNEEGSKLMAQSDQELDVAKRTEQIHQIAKIMASDHALLPLFQFPNIAAWRTDRLSGPIDKDAGNYMAFENLWEWKPASGDKIVIGAEQWPDCLNEITECASSSWYVWTTEFKVLIGVWDTTSDGTYVPTELVTGEPKVEVL